MSRRAFFNQNNNKSNQCCSCGDDSIGKGFNSFKPSHNSDELHID